MYQASDLRKLRCDSTPPSLPILVMLDLLTPDGNHPPSAPRVGDMDIALPGAPESRYSEYVPPSTQLFNNHIACLTAANHLA